MYKIEEYTEEQKIGLLGPEGFEGLMIEKGIKPQQPSADYAMEEDILAELPESVDVSFNKRPVVVEDL